MLVGQGKIRTRELELVTRHSDTLNEKTREQIWKFTAFALSNKFYIFPQQSIRYRYNLFKNNRPVSSFNRQIKELADVTIRS